MFDRELSRHDAQAAKHFLRETGVVGTALLHCFVYLAILMIAVVRCGIRGSIAIIRAVHGDRDS